MQLWNSASETLLNSEGSLDRKRSLLPREEWEEGRLIFAIVEGAAWSVLWRDAVSDGQVVSGVVHVPSNLWQTMWTIWPLLTFVLIQQALRLLHPWSPTKKGSRSCSESHATTPVVTIVVAIEMNGRIHSFKISRRTFWKFVVSEFGQHNSLLAYSNGKS